MAPRQPTRSRRASRSRPAARRVPSRSTSRRPSGRRPSATRSSASRRSSPRRPRRPPRRSSSSSRSTSRPCRPAPLRRTSSCSATAVPVAPCTAVDASATPDPCVFLRETLAGGDIRLTVRTSAASTWNVGLSTGLPPLPFNGFFSPVDNLPTLNKVKAGSAVPVKFSLGGNRGLAIFTSGYPRSAVTTCDSTAPVDGIEETVNPGASRADLRPPDRPLHLRLEDRQGLGRNVPPAGRPADRRNVPPGELRLPQVARRSSRDSPGRTSRHPPRAVALQPLQGDLTGLDTPRFPADGVARVVFRPHRGLPRPDLRRGRWNPVPLGRYPDPESRTPSAPLGRGDRISTTADHVGPRETLGR